MILFRFINLTVTFNKCKSLYMSPCDLLMSASRFLTRCNNYNACNNEQTKTILAITGIIRKSRRNVSLLLVVVNGP